MTPREDPSWRLAAVYLLFFLSGAAALMYQVVWFRSLSLVFGGSHLAVTTILCVFMSGLAAGSFVFGNRVHRSGSLLRLYGWLELGIALFAGLFLVFARVYPALYGFLTHHTGASPVQLSLIRVVLSFVALIVPTTLMGGTLPILTAFAAGHSGDLGRHLSYLYGVNTIGAVLGAATSGFVFLPAFGLAASSWIAIAISVLIGLLSLKLQSRAGAAPADPERPGPREDDAAAPDPILDPLPGTLILVGIAASGFCALGYEVLWTRILIIMLAATHYGFTVVLTSFLLGIGLGGAAYGWSTRSRAAPGAGASTSPGRSLFVFGGVQIMIGVLNIVLMVLIFRLPSYSLALQNLMNSLGLGAFSNRQWSNFLMAFSFLSVPSFFMGYAFPLAGRIRAHYRRDVGTAVGEVLSSNTIGAILGAAVSGYVFIHLFGLEKSLKLLALTNVATGLVFLCSAARHRGLTYGAIGVGSIALVAFACGSGGPKLWDTRFFAIYRSNHPAEYSSDAMVRTRLSGTEIEYYAEGAESVVSVLKERASGVRSFITNGRVEASTALQDVQNQHFLGHLPMMLHPDPRNVLIVGAGTGMTLGATSVYPDVKRITLVELEPKMMGVVRAFRDLNHAVIDSPALDVVYNDGRNFLLTTDQAFDVISSDPIHPWFRGAGSLYTQEYFRLCARRLGERGIMSQWLPLYQLDPANIRSIVRTFGQEFRYVLIWLTIYDAEMIGSNAPLILDGRLVKQRMELPAVASDLERIGVRSTGDLLDYFVMGTTGTQAFCRSAIVNTDDNLYLEVSSPHSIADNSVKWKNVRELTALRESFAPVVVNADHVQNREAARLFDTAHQLYLMNQVATPAFASLERELNSRFPGYAPWRALRSTLQGGGVAKLLELGRPDEAWGAAREAMRMDPSNATNREAAVRAASAAGRHADCLEQFHLAARLGAVSPAMALARGRSQVALGHCADGLFTIGRVVSALPGDRAAQAELERARAACGSTPAAPLEPPVSPFR